MRDWIHKLQEDRSFEETLVLMCLTLASVSILGAAVIRALAGAWLNAGFDLFVAAVALLMALYVWYSRKAERAGQVTAVFCLVVVVTVVYLFGIEMLFWAYPGTIATFFLLRTPGTALRLNVVAIAILVPRVLELGPWTDSLTYMITLLASNFLALTFADHMHRSRARLRLMAERDALTGARNRYALDPMLRVALDKMVQHETPASLMVVDVDRFKRVNDDFGHEVGDRVLKHVTQTLINSTRTSDDVFRYGGEELVILANGAAGEAAGQVAEKLRQQIEETAFEGVGRLTISIGVTEALASDTASTWFARADQCMYQAKRAGRNRVVLEGHVVVDREADTAP